MRGSLVRLVLVFGLTALWLMASPASLVLADGVVTNCSDDTQFGDLLAGGGPVTFNCGTKLINLSSTQIIRADTTIDGGGQVTLSGLNDHQLFLVSPGVSLTLRNIVLENGSSSGNGGAIYNGDNGGDGGTLTLENSTIRDSQAAFSGGAIVSTGPLTITNSLLAGNRALNGGALYPRFALAQTTIINSVLRDNHATGTTNGWGGAILAWDGAPVTIEGSDLSSNDARLGGGIYNFLNSSVILNGSTLRDNTALGGGGGVYNDNGTVSLSNATLSRNIVGGNGGGVWNSNGTTALTNVTLSGNKALSGPFVVGNGGGVWNSNGTATLTNVTLSGNEAGDGGGFYNINGTATLTNVTLSGNLTSVGGGGNGGGVWNGNGTTTLTNVTLSGNSASLGGGIYHNSSISGRILTLKNSIVADSPKGGNCFQVSTSVTSITSIGFNLSGDDSCLGFLNQGTDLNKNPLLGPLTNNGGPTLTHLPQAGSPAIDHGSGCPPTDQRGAARPVGPACDIGAVEYGALFPWLYLPLISK